MNEPAERSVIDLVVDGISDPRNVPALLSLVDLLQCSCLFRDRHDLRGQLGDSPYLARMVEAPPLEQWANDYDLVLAVENHPNARNIYEYRPPGTRRCAMVVGNERKGLDRKVSRLADVMLEIPMRARPGISLNVASAAAAALYQLVHATAPKRHKRTRGLDRPALIFWEPSDPADLGSSMRTAYALGWDRAWLVDRHNVWFGADRSALSQGRGAARRHKTPIRIQALDPEAPAATYDLAFLIHPTGAGVPVWQMRIPAGASSVLVFSETALEGERVRRLAAESVPVCIAEASAQSIDSPLRIASAIALVEAARVVR
jgi:tRNA G18 (ribose-2'-O)-methylase SpoU